MTAALELAFDVECPADRAFAVWTSGIGTWWPPDHTMSGDPETVVLEGRIGGRVYERRRDGGEHDWGVVTGWDPPRRVAFTWHLGRAPADATEVEVRFVGQGATRTRVEISHRGWERLADDGDVRERTHANWAYVMDRYIAHAPGTGGAG